MMNPITVTGFDLCNTSYSFTVVAETLGGSGEMSPVVNPQTLDFLSKC